jgi:hypothetical protein
MIEDNSGPAFPCDNIVERTDGFLAGPQISSSGITKREYFAGKVLQGFCANPAVFSANNQNGWCLVNTTEEQLSEYCLKIADTILEIAK